MVLPVRVIDKETGEREGTVVGSHAVATGADPNGSGGILYGLVLTVVWDDGVIDMVSPSEVEAVEVIGLEDEEAEEEEESEEGEEEETEEESQD